MSTPYDLLADRLFEAIGAGDLGTVADCMSADMTVWTNFDGNTVTRDASLATIGWLSRKVVGLRYEVVDRTVIDGGFVQQHVLHGAGPTGIEIAMPACLVVTVSDDLVTSMREYCDPSAILSAFPR